MFMTLLGAKLFDASAGSGGSGGTGGSGGDGSSITTIDLTLGSINNLIPANRIIKPSPTPVSVATSLTTSSPTKWSAPMSPLERAWWGVDFSGLLHEGETLDTIEQIIETATAGALGLAISYTSGFKPMLDRDANMLAIYLTCTPPSGSTAFNGAGQEAGLTFVARTFGAFTSAYPCTGSLTLRNT